MLLREDELSPLLESLISLPKECEWVEFKENKDHENEIGEYISALSNGACLQNVKHGYLVYGVKDITHEVVGTNFKPKLRKVGTEELENWLSQRLSPRIDFEIYEFKYNNKPISLFRIMAAQNIPVNFQFTSYVRIGSIKRKLREFNEKERKIWNNSTILPFEKDIAKENVSASEIIDLLDTQAYFSLLKKPYPPNRDQVIEIFKQEKLILKTGFDLHITNLGAILFAKNLEDFENLRRKSIRVIQYQGNDKLHTLKDQPGVRGYAVGFGGLIRFINNLLPSNEVIGQALRETVRMYPELAIRELVANSIIHQDFTIKGTGPTIEIFKDRVEILNPGTPILPPERFVNESQSRNEILAMLLRKFGICEEAGTGIDKVVSNIEAYQLPPYYVQVQERHTKIILYAYKKYSEMDKNDRVFACYQHACLKYASNDKMSNQSLRERFKISESNSAMISRVIKDTHEAGLIKEEDPGNTSRKYSRYIPFWA